MWYLLFAIFMVATTNAAVYNGTCPDPPPAVKNFNGTAWMANKWYVISTYNDDPLIQGSCPIGLELPNATEYIVTYWNVLNNVQHYAQGTLKMQTSNETSAKFLLSLGNVFKEWSTRIIALDYNHYAVIYNCVYNSTSNTHTIFPWIKSRTKVIEGTPKAELEAFIKNSTAIDSSKLKQLDFSDKGCSSTSSYYRSD